MAIRACALLLAVGGALVVTPGGVAGQGQEVGGVAGDVMIPPPRELATSTPAASGLGPGGATAGLMTMAAYRAAVENVVAQVRARVMTEREARTQLGDFTVSLLVRAGVVSFGDGGEQVEASRAGPAGVANYFADSTHLADPSRTKSYFQRHPRHF